MKDSIIFTYGYNGALFGVFAQPIIENNTNKTIAFELLSHNINISYIKVSSNHLSPADITRISCIKIKKIAELLSTRRQIRQFRVHINIHYKTLFNIAFIHAAKKERVIKFAFEIKGFECGPDQKNRLKNIFSIIKSYGHEIWLDEHGINKSTTSLLLELPWDGVKIDKAIVWRSTIKQLSSLVNTCKIYVKKVTLEGIEDEYLYKISLYTNSTFSQGFHWKLLGREYLMHQGSQPL